MIEIDELTKAYDGTVVVDAVLDERRVSQGGAGYLKVTVNGKTIINRTGPILQVEATQPYTWSLAMYLYDNKTPLPFSRFGYWKRARMLTMY